jgi:hypothetical protein
MTNVGEPPDAAASAPDPAGGAYDAASRRRIADQLALGKAPRCPVCDSPLAQSAVATPPGVPYVRKRLLLVCSRCRRSATLDAR